MSSFGLMQMPCYLLSCCKVVVVFSCQSCLILCDPMNCSMPSFPVLHYFPKFSQTGVYWVSDDIQSSHPLSPPSCPQSFPASESFPMSWLFASGGQSVDASVSVLPINIQGWCPSGWTGWISLQSMGLSRVFSSTTIQKHQFFGAQPSLPSNSHNHEVVK